MLDPARIAFYRDEGYLVLPGFFDESDVDGLRAAACELEELGKDTDRSTEIVEVDDSHRHEAPRVRRIRFPHRHHPAFLGAITSAKMQSLLQAVLGEHVRLNASKLNLKNSRTGEPVGFHQDWAFYPHTNDDLLSVGVFLDDVAVDNGPLLVLPRSHKGSIFDHHDKGVFVGAIDLAANGLALADFVPVTGQRGTVEIHHVRTLHGSAANASERSRRICFYEVAAADAWPLLGMTDGYYSSYAHWNSGTMIFGEAPTSFRMESLPVSVPYPSPYDGAVSEKGSIYEIQARAEERMRVVSEA
jgi:ectoine hydroxylase-related dioxygenase (phytanoyl-CoA dioxygenase family)